jgi:hypothetical protein
MKPSDLVEKMMKAGATLEACVIALKALEDKDDADAQRREKAAERKRRQRAKDVTVTGQSRDSHGDKVSKEKSPHTPLKENNPPIVPPSGDVCEFERFWTAYPRKQGTSKPKARDAFRKLDPGEQKQALACVEAFARSVAQTEERYVPHAATWLNQRRFETLAEQSAEVSPIVWGVALRAYRDRGSWPRHLGAAPDERGCKCPAEILAEFGYTQSQ